jgi:drug/metabolite transporter (DMT)-like permease
MTAESDLKVQRLAVLETALAICLWALSFIYIKIALREMSPSTLIVIRFALGSSILFAVAARRGDLRWLKLKDLPPLILLGAVGVTLQQILQVSGQVHADAGVAAFLASTAPAFLVLMAGLFLRERLSWSQVSGVFLATMGAAVVSVGGNFQLILQGRLANPGNFLVLLSAVVWALFSIMNRKIMQGRPPVLVAAGMMTFGWLFTLPFFFVVRGWQELAVVSPAGWGAVLYVSVFSTALAYLLYGHALKHAPASRLAAIQNIEPLIAVAAAVLILGEQVGLALLLGGGAIISGVYLAERNAIRTSASPAGRGAAD